MKIGIGIGIGIGIDYFTFDGNSYVLICDYFSKFPFLYRAKTSFWSLRDRLIDLFSIEGYPDEIVSDNGPPFQSKEFAKFLSGLGIKHTTSSPGYPRSNGFIERHIQTVKNMQQQFHPMKDQMIQRVRSCRVVKNSSAL